MKLVLLILFCIMGIIGCLYKLYPTQSLKLWNKSVMMTRKFICTNNHENPSMSEECCYKMRHLASELSRKHRQLRIYRSSLRLSKMSTANLDWVTDDYMEVANLDLSIGSDTEEWAGQRVNLWGILPLWQASPSPDIVLSLDRIRPGDCWPFSGSSGSLHMHLPGHLAIKRISLEHVRPDTAKSAPERFEVYGVRMDGVQVSLVESVYRREGPAKQYFSIPVQDKFIDVIFNVKSNQGNPTYTCIYRIQLYTSVKDYNDGIWKN